MLESAPSEPAAVLAVRSRIEEACRRAGRPPEAVRIVAVTKGHPWERVRWAPGAGLTDLGENYVAELEDKRSKEQEAPAGVRWHFLGRLQSNKAGRIAELADVVHSAEPGSGIAALGRRAVSAGRSVDVLAQVDFTGSRQGCFPDRIPEFLDELEALEGVRLTGLMAFPPLDPRQPSAETSRPAFAALRELRDQVVGAHPGLTELSMGTTSDYEVAVQEGATMVRIGTALFGERPSPGANR